MKTTVYLDEASSVAMKEIPRKVSASAIFRHILKAMITTDKEWGDYIKNDPEGKEVRAYIHETPLIKRMKK